VLTTLEPMVDKRPHADRILVAQLTGEARHRAKWRELIGDEEAAAVAELQALAGGRADLLAEVAGIFEGASEGEMDEPLARCAAQLYRKAGADQEAMPAWIEEGRSAGLRRASRRSPGPTHNQRGSDSRTEPHCRAGVMPRLHPAARWETSLELGATRQGAACLPWPGRTNREPRRILSVTKRIG
jgi:hypothetical protein